MSATWQRVIFGAECGEDGACPVCVTVDFAECPCLGPTEDDVEYREVDGVLEGRRISNSGDEK